MQTYALLPSVDLEPASWIWVLAGSARLSCRQSNVVLTLHGQSAEQDRAALSPMLKRVTAGLQP